MKIGVITKVYYHFEGSKEAFLKMKADGYDTTDYQVFLKQQPRIAAMSDGELDAFLDEEKKNAEAAGIEIYQVHAPWDYPPRDGEVAIRERRHAATLRALKGAARLGATALVVHPLAPECSDEAPDPDAVWQLNLDYFRDIVALGKKLGVYIAIENLPWPKYPFASPESVLKMAKELGDEVKVCLDVGHANVLGVNLYDTVTMLGDRLIALHLHDNDGTGDQHRLPFSGTADWDGFCRGLAEIGFTGSLSLETSRLPLGSLSEAEADSIRIQNAGLVKRLRRMVDSHIKTK